MRALRHSPVPDRSHSRRGTSLFARILPGGKSPPAEDELRVQPAELARRKAEWLGLVHPAPAETEIAVAEPRPPSDSAWSRLKARMTAIVVRLRAELGEDVDVPEPWPPTYVFGIDREPVAGIDGEPAPVSPAAELERAPGPRLAYVRDQAMAVPEAVETAPEAVEATVGPAVEPARKSWRERGTELVAALRARWPRRRIRDDSRAELERELGVPVLAVLDAARPQPWWQRWRPDLGAVQEGAQRWSAKTWEFSQRLSRRLRPDMRGGQQRWARAVARAQESWARLRLARKGAVKAEEAPTLLGLQDAGPDIYSYTARATGQQIPQELEARAPVARDLSEGPAVIEVALHVVVEPGGRVAGLAGDAPWPGESASGITVAQAPERKFAVGQWIARMRSVLSVAGEHLRPAAARAWRIIRKTCALLASAARAEPLMAVAVAAIVVLAVVAWTLRPSARSTSPEAQAVSATTASPVPQNGATDARSEAEALAATPSAITEPPATKWSSRGERRRVHSSRKFEPTMVVISPAKEPAKAAVAAEQQPSPGILGWLREYLGGSPRVEPKVVDPNVRVWVDTDTGLYHCAGSEWYGRTAHGRFEDQRHAIYESFQPAYNTPCQ